MANTILATGALTFTTSGVSAIARAVTSLSISASGGDCVYHAGWSVPTMAGGTAIPLGSLANLGYAYFRNLDNANDISLLNATSGTQIVLLHPGEFAVFRFGSGISAPAAIAANSPSLLEYFIINQ